MQMSKAVLCSLIVLLGGAAGDDQEPPPPKVFTLRTCGRKLLTCQEEVTLVEGACTAVSLCGEAPVHMKMTADFTVSLTTCGEDAQEGDIQYGYSWGVDGKSGCGLCSADYGLALVGCGEPTKQDGRAPTPSPTQGHGEEVMVKVDGCTESHSLVVDTCKEIPSSCLGRSLGYVRAVNYTGTSVAVERYGGDSSCSIVLLREQSDVCNSSTSQVQIVRRAEACFKKLQVEKEGVEFSLNGLVGRFQDQAEVRTAELVGGELAVAVWERVDDLENPKAVSIQGRLVNGRGQRSGLQFQVNMASLGRRAYPEVAGLSNGGFVVVWQCGAAKVCGQVFKLETNFFGQMTVVRDGAEMVVSRAEDGKAGKAVGVVRVAGLREGGLYLVQYQVRDERTGVRSVLRVLRPAGDEAAVSELSADAARNVVLEVPLRGGRHFLMSHGVTVYAGHVHSSNGTVGLEPLAVLKEEEEEKDADITAMSIHAADNSFVVVSGRPWSTARAALLSSKGAMLTSVPLPSGIRSARMRALDGFHGTVLAYSLEANDVGDDAYRAFDVYCTVLVGPHLQKVELEGKVNTQNRQWLGGLTIDVNAPFLLYPAQGVQDWPAIITLSREEGRQFLIFWQSDSLEGLSSGEIGLSGHRFALRDI